jgi:hypothetical protein
VPGERPVVDQAVFLVPDDAQVVVDRVVEDDLGLRADGREMRFFMDPRTPEPILRPAKTGAPLMAPVWTTS